MEHSFQNKIVWITGASSGIGEALARRLCDRGAHVIVSSRNIHHLQQVKQACEGAAGKIDALPMDLTDPAQISSTVHQVLRTFGHIDVLILNAGIVARDLAVETDMSIDRLVMETNYFGSIALTKAVLPSMIGRGSGHLVVISSLSGIYGVPRLSAYSASKHALHGFFGSLRAETLRQGIKITMIVPGFINTPIINKAIDGKGTPRNKNLHVNETGMSADRCAQGIIRAIEKRKQVALIGGAEMSSVFLHRYFPGLFRSMIANNPMRRLRKGLPWLFR